MIVVNTKHRLPPHTTPTTTTSNYSIVSPQTIQLPASVHYHNNSIN